MKNIFLITFLFLLYGCGYTSVYKDNVKQDFKFSVTEMNGDRVMNNLIKNQLNLYSNKNSSNIYKIVIDTNYNKIIYAKNSAGVATDYQISANSIFTVLINEKSKKFSFNEKINIKNQSDTFNQNSYEKNIKKNFASSFKDKLISEIVTMK